jgi:hypothetical protein
LPSAIFLGIAFGNLFGIAFGKKSFFGIASQEIFQKSILKSLQNLLLRFLTDFQTIFEGFGFAECRAFLGVSRLFFTDFYA